MSNANSSKALPTGTILREWRLEQVLGSSGFGIVYKARGIYFDEMVAIKEYFPRAISERDDNAAVVPIDSDAEEAYTLGLKNFVEEAKLLWNLSTPARHPNLVSVRSLFEIHGTAYMVMDLENGVPLSKTIKQGARFDEASLTGLMAPIADGLDRAHRVGVIHRDVKPQNILVNEDGCPVLIEFGLDRLGAGERASTAAASHTAPYAAIEQYVKTYDQGPWTDIYALGVVMYECITGRKPPEVLERLHGGLGQPLASERWPGFSQQFLAAVDAAMIIKPSERPQSLSQWFEMFGKRGSTHAEEFGDGFDEAGVAAPVSSFLDAPDGYLPDAPQTMGIALAESTHAVAFTDLTQLEFVPAGDETSALRDVAEVPPLPASEGDEAGALHVAEPEPVPPASESAGTSRPRGEPPAPPPPSAARKAINDASRTNATTGRRPGLGLLGGSALAALLLLGGGWYLSSGSSGQPDETLAEEVELPDGEPVAPVDIEAAGGITAAMTAFAQDAEQAGAPAAAVGQFKAAIEQLTRMEQGMSGLGVDAARALEAEMASRAMAASAQFSRALLNDAEGRLPGLAREVPWADARGRVSAASLPADRRSAANAIRTSLARIRDSAASAASAATPEGALTAAREALAGSSAYRSAVARAGRLARSPAAAASAAGPLALSEDADAPAPEVVAPTGNDPADDAQRRQLASAIGSARDIANRVIRMGERPAPAADASKREKDGHLIRQANVRTARDYQKYLDTLENSMRGNRTQKEADQLIAGANQTRAYLAQLLAGSQATQN